MSPFFISETFKRRFPWFIKMPLKIALSRLPFGIQRWQHVNLFRAGAMDSPAYAWSVFKQHFESSALKDLRDRTILELGPGNSLLTALFAHSLGAARTWLVDGEPLASQDVALFAKAELMLMEFGMPVPRVSAASSVAAILDQLKAEYLTSGLASLRTVPDGAVDFLFSNAVMEHIRLAEFVSTAKEMRRVLKPNGVASHVIDFKDHLQNALNNLRFSHRVWESRFMSSSGFYTNRLTWPKMEELFRDAGFAVEVLNYKRWPNGLPTSQTQMAMPFRDLPAEDFMVMEVHILVRAV